MPRRADDADGSMFRTPEEVLKNKVQDHRPASNKNTILAFEVAGELPRSTPDRRANARRIGTPDSARNTRSKEVDWEACLKMETRTDLVDDDYDEVDERFEVSDLAGRSLICVWGRYVNLKQAATLPRLRGSLCQQSTTL